MLKWNDDLLDQVAERLVGAVDEIDLRLEAEAKSELYPGHGVLSSTMQRSIHMQPARLEGDKVVGAVGTEPLSYALKMHDRYEYLKKGLEKVEPDALTIIERHIRGRP